MNEQTAPKQIHIGILVPVAVVFLVFGLLLGRTWNMVEVGESPRASTTGSVIGIGQSPPQGFSDDVDFRIFWDTWNHLKENYYKQPVDDKALLYSALHGLAAGVDDPYTSFFEPEDAQLFEDSLSGKFGGIGAEIGLRNERITIITPLPDTPAERAGLKPNDIILAVDEQSVEGFRVDEAVRIIRGEPGTSVTLQIFRESDTEKPEFEVSLIREEILLKSVRWKELPGGIALIELVAFNADTPELFDQVLTEILRKDPKGIILDMRNNPGGYLQVSQYIAGAWIGEEVVVKERRQGAIFDELRGTGQRRLAGIPTVVLVNEGSASAAEIVAGALQDHAAATVVGKKTFGKGSVQDLIDLRDGSAIKITIAEWLTPKERTINTTGLEPDVTIEYTQKDYEAKKDPQLDRAIGILNGTAPIESTTSTIPTP